jgi:protein TonB
MELLLPALLYNKHTIMEKTTLLHADYLDIIFDNRNKNYGGYELRKHYNRRLAKAGAFIALGLGALISCSFINMDHPVKPVINAEPIAFKDVDITPIQKVIPKPPRETLPPPPPAHMKTKVFNDPVIDPTDHIPDDKQMTQNRDLTDAHPGSRTAEGTDSLGEGMVPVVATGPGIVKLPEPAKPREWVEQMPQFNGDMSAYISARLKYPDAARDAGIEGAVLIKFVVNENGNVSNAVVVRGIGGGCDQEALSMVNSMPTWKPGRQNGTPVKVYFTLPIKFVLN